MEYIVLKEIINRVCKVCTSAPSCLTLCNLMDCSSPAPLSKVLSRQEYWNGLPFPSQGDLPEPGIEPVSPVSPALAGGFFTSESTGKSM